MYSPLSDVVTCPRCGPGYGLVLLAERSENRRVLEGWFGCSNCREKYVVSGGFCELTYGGVVPAAAGLPGLETERLAAMLGVTEGPALLLLAGAGAQNAGQLADLVEGVEVVAVSTSLRDTAERAGVSRFAQGSVLPFRNASMQGI